VAWLTPSFREYPLLPGCAVSSAPLVWLLRSYNCGCLLFSVLSCYFFCFASSVANDNDFKS
jgi:hypothetical protein